MNTIWLIARREFRVRALSKASLISTAIIVGLLVGGAIIAKPLLAGDGEPARVDVSRSAADLVPYLESLAHAQDEHLAFNVVEAAGEPAVAEDAIALISGDPVAPELYWESENNSLLALTATATQAFVLDGQLAAVGADADAVQAALAQATPTVIHLGEPNEFDPGAFFAGMALILILFFVLVQSASVIMMGVVEEKTSRVVEILLATVRPGVLLGGKVLGVGMYSLFQAVTMFAPMLFAAWYLDLLQYLDMGVGVLVVNFGLWFLLGFALFTVFFGGLAALVSRQEDIGSVSTPMVILMMIPLYLGIYLVPSSPDGPVTQVLTQIPFFAPFMVPMRSAFGAIETWEVALAIGLCLVAIPLLTMLAGRVYAGAVLNTGGRMKVKDALRGR